MVCVLALWPSLISHINGLHCLLFKIWLVLPTLTFQDLFLLVACLALWFLLVHYTSWSKKNLFLNAYYAKELCKINVYKSCVNEISAWWILVHSCFSRRLFYMWLYDTWQVDQSHVFIKFQVGYGTIYSYLVISTFKLVLLPKYLGTHRSVPP